MTFAGTTLAGDGPAGDRLITDFRAATPDLGWHVVNDNVMGGRSDGGFELEPGMLHFSGRTNTEGGGFSSIRTGSLQLDLSPYDAIRLRVQGDGRRYTWRLTTDASYYGRALAYWADFETTADEWRTIDVPFSHFVPRFRGSVLDGPPLDTGSVSSMGLMIYDKRDGPFELRLASISAAGSQSPFSLQQYRWQKRVLVVSAPRQDDPALREQLEAISTTRDAFEERDMVLVTLLDEAGSTAGDRNLTSDEVTATRDALRIRPASFALRLVGKDGAVKLAEDNALPMAGIYALIDGMPMRQREIQDR